MLPKRLIIHTENCGDVQIALRRVAHALPFYYEYKDNQNDRRLTIRFLKDGVMAIYHDKSDIVLFGKPQR